MAKKSKLVENTRSREPVAGSLNVRLRDNLLALWRHVTCAPGAETNFRSVPQPLENIVSTHILTIRGVLGNSIHWMIKKVFEEGLRGY